MVIEGAEQCQFKLIRRTPLDIGTEWVGKARFSMHSDTLPDYGSILISRHDASP